MTHSPLRIVLASDSPLWLQAVHAELDALPEVQVVCDAAHGVDTLMACYQLHPDIVVLDLSRTSIPIATLLASVHHFVPTTHIIGYTPTYRGEVATLVTRSAVASYLIDHDLHQSFTQILAVVMAGLLWYSTFL